MEIRKATRQQAKLRLAIGALGGGGKTYTTLIVATILSLLMRPRLGRRGRICGIDTEHESMELYSMTERERDAYAAMSDKEALRYITRKDANAFDFDVLQLSDHSPRKYVDAINLVASKGYDICIVDSLSHAWAGKNGALEQKDNIAARGGNSYTAWRDVTPMHNLLVDTMLACPMHLFATLRKKMEYVQEKDASGKTVIRQVGLADIQREGMEYEFTIFADMEKDTNSMRISKHRLPGVLNIGDVFEKPGEVFTLKIWDWLMSGAEPTARPVEQPAVLVPAAPSDISISDAMAGIDTAPTLEALEALVPQLKSLTGEAAKERNRRYRARKEWLQTQAVAAPPRATDAMIAAAGLVRNQETGTLCSVCDSSQVESPSGVTCKFGHGGAPAKTAPTQAANESTRSPQPSVSTSPRVDGSISVEAREASSRTDNADSLGRTAYGNDTAPEAA